jgi:RNA polymerase sigma factor (TIGR02999 family)
MGLAASGSKSAVDQLLDVVYDELRRLAQGYLDRERPEHTLQATALVHEAYLKLVSQQSVGFRDRAAFFGAAATVMRRILVDHARAKRREKRGGDAVRIVLDEALAVFQEGADDLSSLDEALTALAALDQRKARLVELRFFAGVSMAETAQMLGISLRSAERDWTLARAWLRSHLDRTSPASQS